MRTLVFLLVLYLSIPAYAQIKKVPIYPAGISVAWIITPSAFAEEEISKKDAKTKKRLSKKEREKEKESAAALPPTPDSVAVTRLVRVISAITVKESESLALVFYDSAKKHLKKFNMAVTNTAKPSPANAFFMDKAVYSDFKGLLDAYFFPPSALYMNIAIVDKRGNIITVPTHPSYDGDRLLSIAEFEDLEKGKRMMLQFEIHGGIEKNVLRMGIFRFR